MGLVDPAVPKYLMGQVNAKDAEAAYTAFLQFQNVVKKNPIGAGAVSSPANAKVDAAEAKLADSSYAFLKDIDWSSTLSVQPTGFTGTVADQMKAVDKALLMGADMNWGALKEAALAHVAGINNMDAKGVATKADYQAMLAGLGKAIAAVPAKDVMAVYDSFGKVVNKNVPSYLYSSVNGADAVSAYKGFLEFKDVVKATR